MNANIFACNYTVLPVPCAHLGSTSQTQLYLHAILQYLANTFIFEWNSSVPRIHNNNYTQFNIDLQMQYYIWRWVYFLTPAIGTWKPALILQFCWSSYCARGFLNLAIPYHTKPAFSLVFNINAGKLLEELICSRKFLNGRTWICTEAIKYFFGQRI